MKKFIALAVLLLCTLAVSAQRERTNFDFDWEFRLTTDDDRMPVDANWYPVQLPHDWSISQTPDSRLTGCNGHLHGGVGDYRKKFNIPAKDKGRSIAVLFDGIYNRSTVRVNGHTLGFRPYGFCYIEYDLTPYLNYGGENEIAVHVNSPSANDSIARWYTGNGIYRHAWLIKTNPAHIATYGTYVVTNGNKVTVKTETVGHIAKPRLVHKIFDAQGKQVAKGNNEEPIEVRNATLWNGMENPYLYRVVTTLYDGGKLLDTYESTFGFRTAEFTPDRGFLLNGKRVKLKGFCLHQDDACLGTALPLRSMERRLEMFREYGVNAVRCSHNQPAPEFLDLCDKMGFIVIDEAFDKWKSGYYAQYFDEWWQRDLKNMIVRDRNHPCVVTWSIGNELQEAWDDSGEGVQRAKMLQDFVHQLEPTRQVCMACQNNHNGAFSGVTDVVGYNYLEARMLNDHKTFPERRFLVTEELPYYCGAEGNIRAYDTNNPWNIIEANDFIAGGFIWTGQDYIGEASWPSSGWPTGLIDLSGTEKAQGLWHRAAWNPDKPVVGIAVRDNGLDIDHGRDLWQWPNMASIWNFPFRYEGLVIEVNTITNCERVQLIINNKVMGEKRTADYPNHTIVWNVPFTPGHIEAKGINGTDTVAYYDIRTAGKPARLRATADRTELAADGQDLSYIQLQLLDKDGNPVGHENRHIRASIEGEGILRGCINNNLRRTTPFTSTEDDTHFGRAFAIVQTTRKAGDILVRFDVEGMEPVVVKLHSKNSIK